MEWVVVLGAVIVSVFAGLLLIIKVFLPRMIIRELEEYENELVARQFEEINNTYHEMRGWRHDYRNHMQVLKSYIDRRQWEECTKYILEMDQDLSSVDHVIKTGNVMADAIVNSKVSLARTREISLDVTAKIPEHLPVSDVEFCVLFGNLMDNAIEACEKIEETGERFIRIYIGMFHKQFYISVTNATNRKVRVGRYFSLKGEGHGFGLYRIDKIIKQRQGYLKRSDEPGVFATEIMLPFAACEG